MKITITTLTKKRKSADLFVTGVFDRERLPKSILTAEPGFGAAFKKASAAGRFTGGFGESLSSYNEGHKEASEILAIGLGKKKNYKTLCLQKAFGIIIQAAKARKAKNIRIFADSFAGGSVNLADAVETLSLFAHLSDYRFDKYKANAADAKKSAVDKVELLLSKGSAESAAQKRVDRAAGIGGGIMLCRDLINEPGNVLNAPKMVSEVKKMASKKKLSCKVIGEAELKRMKMGGILAVNQGAVTPPALIITEHGTRHKSKGTVCLVGKGVTFDTGGISIKPSKDMEKMKYDMSGSAAVIGTMSAVADLNLPVHVVGITPMVENNVANDPQRPGDIIKMYNGKTVEVLNTDAEGRLILADALAYSEIYKPKAIIDLATLTGMCAYTFGDKAIALMSNDDKLTNRLMKAGTNSGERCWELPMWDDYRAQIVGHHSDLLNIGGPFGGTITAGKFLQEFVPAKTPWVHLDIAGTAWCNSPRFDCPKGATGVGVKLLVDFLSNWKR